jgi:hypothetical protein
MSYAVFLLGNFGVGKSSILDLPVLDKTNILLHVGNNNWVLGKSTIGADSLSGFDKSKVFDFIKQHPDKNIIIAGIYYSQYNDFIKIRQSHKPVAVYLNTSYENNAKRIAKRGKLINPNTYTAKLKTHASLLKKLKGIATRYVLDNNRELEVVKSEFWQLVGKYST